MDNIQAFTIHIRMAAHAKEHASKDWNLTMSEGAKEKTYNEAEIKARLEQELPRWVYEGGWIRRKFRTASWKGTLMVINTVGHLAEAAWHHKLSLKRKRLKASVNQAFRAEVLAR